MDVDSCQVVSCNCEKLVLGGIVVLLVLPKMKIEYSPGMEGNVLKQQIEYLHL